MRDVIGGVVVGVVSVGAFVGGGVIGGVVVGVVVVSVVVFGGVVLIDFRRTTATVRHKPTDQRLACQSGFFSFSLRGPANVSINSFTRPKRSP